jgi:hypothetical protein
MKRMMNDEEWVGMVLYLQGSSLWPGSQVVVLLFFYMIDGCQR